MVVQATQELVTRVPMATKEEMQAASDSAQRAFKQWAETPISARARVMFKLQALISENMVRSNSISFRRAC